MALYSQLNPYQQSKQINSLFKNLHSYKINNRILQQNNGKCGLFKCKKKWYKFEVKVKLLNTVYICDG